MAIDFYLLDDNRHRNLIFQLEERDLSVIEDVLIKLQSLTGLVIDAYGKTRMYPDHVKLWLKLLEEFEFGNKVKKEKFYSKIMNLKEFLRMIVKNHEGLSIVGD